MITDSDGNWYPTTAVDKIRLAEIAERLKGLGLIKRIKKQRKIDVKTPTPTSPPSDLETEGRRSDIHSTP